MMARARRLVIGLALLGAASAGSAAAQQPAGGTAQPGMRIGFVRAGEVLRQMPGYAKAESTYTRELRAAEGEAQKIRAPLDSALAQFQQAAAMMTPTNRTARQRQLEAQRDSVESRLQALQERVGARERELLAPMQQRLAAVIEGIRAENNLWMIIDLGNRASENIVSYDKSLDITDRVLRRLQQSSN